LPIEHKLHTEYKLNRFTFCIYSTAFYTTAHNLNNCPHIHLYAFKTTVKLIPEKCCRCDNTGVTAHQGVSFDFVYCIGEIRGQGKDNQLKLEQ